MIDLGFVFFLLQFLLILILCNSNLIGRDKWNTLVHAARIPRERRRAEPIPQELFDGVLTAHTLG